LIDLIDYFRAIKLTKLYIKNIVTKDKIRLVKLLSHQYERAISRDIENWQYQCLSKFAWNVDSNGENMLKGMAHSTNQTVNGTIGLPPYFIFYISFLKVSVFFIKDTILNYIIQTCTFSMLWKVYDIYFCIENNTNYNTQDNNRRNRKNEKSKKYCKNWRKYFSICKLRSKLFYSLMHNFCSMLLIYAFN